MSESEPYSEQERPPLSSVRRYYDVLQGRDDNLAMIVMAADELIECLPFRSDVKLEDFFDVDFIDSELDAEPRIAKELLGMMPFMYIGPLLDKSNCVPKDIKDWYMDATKGLILLTKNDHNVACLESDEGTLNHMSCDKSALCPHRFLERYLIDDVRIVDFADERYNSDPLQTMAIAMIKAQVAKDCQIVLAIYGEAALVSYSHRCQEYLDQMISQREVSVDDILRDKL